MELWWSRAERLRWELAQLTQLGYRYNPPEDLDTEGPFNLRVYADFRGGEVALDVTFPPFYPYVRCEVKAADLELPFHQHPFEKNLCLLGRETYFWEPWHSLAWLLEEQLPKLAAALDADSAASAAGLEEAQAEPVSDYYPYLVGDVVLVDSAWIIPPEFSRGRVELGYVREKREDRPFRAAVREVTSLDGRRLFTAPEHLLGLFPDRISGDLIRLDEPLLVSDAEEFQRTLRKSTPPRWQGPPSQRSVLGVVFPEQSSWRDSGGRGTGWLFVVGTRAKKHGPAKYRFVRADRAGVADLSSRAPELGPLRDHKVAVIGLGCLGAPSALEFARAGVGELRLLDRDRVDAAAGLRWPFGLLSAGLPKAMVLHSFIRGHYPLTKTIWACRTLGGADDDIAALDEILDGITLVFDAAAELGLSYLLADWARHAGVPYVVVSSVPGAWGGKVARLLPERETGCWYCLQRAETEGAIPPPPHDPSGRFQPTGCANPTFYGAGFDLSSVAMAGVRMAVATMLRGREGYPASPDDVLVIRFRDEQGALIAPCACGFRLAPFADCPACAPQGTSR